MPIDLHWVVHRRSEAGRGVESTHKISFCMFMLCYGNIRLNLFIVPVFHFFFFLLVLLLLRFPNQQRHFWLCFIFCNGCMGLFL